MHEQKQDAWRYATTLDIVDSVYTLKLRKGCRYTFKRMGENRVRHEFSSSALIPDEFLAENEGSSLQFIESHGSDLVLEGILVSHSLWYAKLASGFWKENLKTHCLLLDVSSSPNEHQCCLQANSFVSFQNVHWYTVRINSTSSCQHCKAGLFFFVCVCFFSPHFGTGFFQMDKGKNKKHVNPTAKNLCHTEACALNIKRW